MKTVLPIQKQYKLFIYIPISTYKICSTVVGFFGHGGNSVFIFASEIPDTYV